ncbi:hypothetical protein T484DRAFT_1923031, partial [Baffinella frigidus]
DTASDRSSPPLLCLVLDACCARTIQRPEHSRVSTTSFLPAPTPGTERPSSSTGRHLSEWRLPCAARTLSPG